jgi:hypothetical protein
MPVAKSGSVAGRGAFPDEPGDGEKAMGTASPVTFMPVALDINVK